MAFLEQAANRGSISTGYDIDNSCGFETSESEYMTKDNAATVTAERKTFTISVWVKRSKLGGDPMFVFEFGETDYNYTGRTWLRFDDDQLQMGAGSIYWFKTNRLFRDPAAWYHIVLAIDTTLGTAANRHRLYVNGVEETSWHTEGTPDQNLTHGFSLNENHSIGRSHVDNGSYFNGYMAEFHAVGGSQLTPSDFGETDEDSGIWKPKKYSGSHGTNGWYLDFADSSNMGNDASGGLDFTENNIAAANQAVDSPTNNFNVMTPLVTYGYPTTLTHGNTKVTDNSSGFGGAASNFAMMDGKWYWEFKASSSSTMVGVQGTEAEVQTNNNAHEFPPTMGLYLGGPYNYAMDATSQRNDGSISLTYSSSDIYGVALDLDNNTIYYLQNNTQRGSTFSLDEVGTADVYPHSQGGYMLRPWVGTQGTVETNFGGYTTMSISSAAADANGYGSFEYAPPSGYYALCTKNIAEYG